jgi:O-antigen/teichoic acid export membrane protein
MLVSGVILSLVSWNVAPYISLIRPGLNLSIDSLRILSLSLPLFFLTAPLMWFEISRNQEKRVLYIYLFAVLVNTLLNFAFIPSYGALASAVVTGVTELTIFLFLLHFSLR